MTPGHTQPPTASVVTHALLLRRCTPRLLTKAFTTSFGCFLQETPLVSTDEHRRRRHVLTLARAAHQNTNKRPVKSQQRRKKKKTSTTSSCPHCTLSVYVSALTTVNQVRRRRKDIKPLPVLLRDHSIAKRQPKHVMFIFSTTNTHPQPLQSSQHTERAMPAAAEWRRSAFPTRLRASPFAYRNDALKSGTRSRCRG